MLSVAVAAPMSNVPIGRKGPLGARQTGKALSSNREQGRPVVAGAAQPAVMNVGKLYIVPLLFIHASISLFTTKCKRSELK